MVNELGDKCHLCEEVCDVFGILCLIEDDIRMLCHACYSANDPPLIDVLENVFWNERNGKVNRILKDTDDIIQSVKHSTFTAEEKAFIITYTQEIEELCAGMYLCSYSPAQKKEIEEASHENV